VLEAVIRSDQQYSRHATGILVGCPLAGSPLASAENTQLETDIYGVELQRLLNEIVSRS
jgi:hypothetical protein